MALGPGRYDAHATAVRTRTDAQLVVVIVVGGAQGSGFSVQATSREAERALPDVLDTIAQQIRADVATRERE